MKLERRGGNNEKFDFYMLLSPSPNAEINATSCVYNPNKRNWLRLILIC